MRTLQLTSLVLAVALLSVIPACGQDEAFSAGGFSVPRPGPFVPLAGGSHAVAGTSVTIGAQVSGLPCFNCITNQTVLDVGLSMPLAVVTQGTPVTISVLFEDTTYTGPCSVTYSLLQKKTVVLTGTYTYASGCAANTFNGTYFNITAPSNSGPTTLKAVVTAGSINSTISQHFTIQ